MVRADGEGPMTMPRWAGRWWALLGAPGTRVLERAAGEREIAVNRLAFGGGALLYYGGLWASGITDTVLLAISVSFLLVGGALLFDVYRRPQRSPFRRAFALCLDVGALSAAIAENYVYTLPLCFLYLWVIVGYGFRYGISYLRAAAVLSLAGFAVVVLTTSLYKEYVFLVVGLAGILVAIPPYLEALLRRTLAAIEAARASNDARAFVLSTLSHEMRTPLRAMISVVDQLDATALDPEQRSMLDTVRLASRSILQEMDTLLDVARTEAGHTAVATTEFSTLALMKEVVALASVEARAKGLHLALHVTAGTPLQIQTDRRHLRRIILSLVENAVRFTSIGSVLLSADGSRTKGTTPVLRVEVIDTGIGVASHRRAEIFDAYARADEAVLAQHSGSGLGLSIAKQLAHLLGGRIELDGSPDGGSVFWIEIPVQVRPHHRRPDLRGVGVILLSQEPSRMEAIAGRLARLGARVTVVERADRIGPAMVDSGDDCQRISLVLDGQGIDPVELALAMRRQNLFGRVPLTLLAPAPGLPTAAIRRQYMTTVSPSASDEELCTALQIVGPLDKELRSELNMDPLPPDPRPVQSRRLRVLIADDNRTSQVTLAQVLTHAGHRVRAVGGGDAALDALEREEFDVAIMDLQGPESADAAKLYRYLELGKPRLPIIGLTDGSAAAARQDEGIAAVVDACLSKPVDHGLLLQAVVDAAPVMPPLDVCIEKPPLVNASGVASISSHPRFIAGLGPPPADEFEHFEAIGGAGLGEIAKAFENDAKAALAYLAASLASGDPQAFKGQLATLRSAAVAIDAARLGALCDTGATIPPNKLRSEGNPLLDRLSREVDRVRGVLGRRP